MLLLPVRSDQPEPQQDHPALTRAIRMYMGGVLPLLQIQRGKETVKANDRKGHFGDKILHCQGCDRDILIPHNQAGGFWHLSGWHNPHGIQFWGGYCSPCFRALDNITNQKHDK